MCKLCGALVKENDMDCPKCGVVFEEVLAEEEVPSPVPQSVKVAEEVEILNHPSVSED